MSNGHRGVTLVELCFGVAIVATLVALAAPGFRASLRAAAVRTATFELLAGLQQARGSAILESRTAELCPSNATGLCLSAHTPSSHWQTSGGHEPPVSRTLPAGVVVRASRSPLKFWPNALGASTGTLTICDAQGVAPPRAIVLSLSGRARLATAPGAACG
ncbi:MAG TPA: GspH/FimT family pseudopilin [Steroidobacteraceae bacterium]|nr:GspH/FimT family pseudopilin [Steroidobacteraceae bacterium]